MNAAPGTSLPNREEKTRALGPRIAIAAVAALAVVFGLLKATGDEPAPPPEVAAAPTEEASDAPSGWVAPEQPAVEPGPASEPEPAEPEPAETHEDHEGHGHDVDDAGLRPGDIAEGEVPPGYEGMPLRPGDPLGEDQVPRAGGLGEVSTAVVPQRIARAIELVEETSTRIDADIADAEAAGDDARVTRLSHRRDRLQARRIELQGQLAEAEVEASLAEDQ